MVKLLSPRMCSAKTSAGLPVAEHRQAITQRVAHAASFSASHAVLLSQPTVVYSGQCFSHVESHIFDDLFFGQEDDGVVERGHLVTEESQGNNVRRVLEVPVRADNGEHQPGWVQYPKVDDEAAAFLPAAEELELVEEVHAGAHPAAAQFIEDAGLDRRPPLPGGFV